MLVFEYDYSEEVFIHLNMFGIYPDLQNFKDLSENILKAHEESFREIVILPNYLQ